MEDPTPLKTFLGCAHNRERFKQADGTEGIMIKYDMTEFMKSCVAKYRELCPGARLKVAKTRSYQRIRHTLPSANRWRATPKEYRSVLGV